MNKTYNVLIVDDVPLIIGVIIDALNTVNDTNELIDFKIKSVTNSDDARFEIRKAVNTIPFDLVFLDISIPCSSDNKILSGEDLGLEIKNYFPKIKIIVLTNHNDNFRLNNIFKSLNPEGFIIKTDIDFNKLVEAINTVLNDTPFYSRAVLQLMRKHIVNNFTLDIIDRQLLYQISKGVKTEELIEITGLSKSAIELRKRNLKSVFGIETSGNRKLKSGNRKLIRSAEQHGFI